MALYAVIHLLHYVVQCAVLHHVVGMLCRVAALGGTVGYAMLYSMLRCVVLYALLHCVALYARCIRLCCINLLTLHYGLLLAMPCHVVYHAMLVFFAMQHCVVHSHDGHYNVVLLFCLSLQGKASGPVLI